jgi:hypothetical protein
VGRVQVDLLLEVRNRDHASQVEAALVAGGLVRGDAGEPSFVPASWH